MIHMHTDALLIGRNDVREERNRMHVIALQEARIATEYHESVAASAGTTGPARLAVATAGSGSNVDLAACCA